MSDDVAGASKESGRVVLEGLSSACPVQSEHAELSPDARPNRQGDLASWSEMRIG